MPLSLSAEQKDLLDIFKVQRQYVIPSYQRPYSWEFDHCFQLYTDLQKAYEEQQDYFIGNIIIAKAENNKRILEVVDGQQRLITCLLIFKILRLFQPGLKVLEEIIEKEDLLGNNKVPRISSEVFEANDNNALLEVLSYTLEELRSRCQEVIDKNERIIERKCRSRFECNLLYFYIWIEYFNKSGGSLSEFTGYVLQQVYLLPIELTGATQDDANEKALAIFETINNRGMNLNDADIFKAKLYNRAKKINEEKIFIELWTDFKNYCETLSLTIDDVFRYYSHIIRGKVGITSSEKNLREFFINEKSSPLEQKKYKEIFDDLFKIIGALERLNQEKTKTSKFAKWLQVIDAYTNQYPKFAIVNYLFIKDLVIDDGFEKFLQSLVRYVYYQGSTTTIKFEMYNIIKQTAQGLPISEYYREDIEQNYFEFLGRLNKGFALLAFYLDKEDALPSNNIEKIINLKDVKSLAEDWRDVELNEVIDKIGNFLVTDLPKKNMSFNKKGEYYKQSKLEEVRNLFVNGNFSRQQFIDRDNSLKSRLTFFFKGI